MRRRGTKKAFLSELTVKQLRTLGKRYGVKARSKEDFVKGLWRKTRGVPIEKLKKQL